MKRTAVTLAIAASLLGLAAAPAVQAKEKLSGEEQLAKILEGREAGAPVNCLMLSQINNSRIIDKTAIVYEVGSVVYVNTPTNADQLDDDDILVTKLHTAQLCSLDTVQLYDRGTPTMWRGFVGLREFVPWKKVQPANAEAN